MGRLGNAGQVLGTHRFNITSRATRGQTTGKGIKWGECKFKSRKSHECGRVCIIERRTHLSIEQEYLQFGVPLAKNRVG
jgi:hypothetical protein